MPSKKVVKVEKMEQTEQTLKLAQTQLGRPAPERAEREQPALRYEDGIEQLDALVERMEGGALTLEETLAAYERGMALHAQLDALLKRGERRIQAMQIRDGEPDPQAEWLPLEVEE